MKCNFETYIIGFSGGVMLREFLINRFKNKKADQSVCFKFNKNDDMAESELGENASLLWILDGDNPYFLTGVNYTNLMISTNRLKVNGIVNSENEIELF